MAEPAIPPVVLVTGASRGIGAEVARVLAVAGCDLMLTARSATELERVAAEIRSSGRRVSTLAIDIVEPGASETIVRATCSALGRIDALVCCAGVLHVSPLLKTTDQSLMETITLNLLVPIRLSREVARVMVAQRSGRIVHVASKFAFVSAPGYAAYTASKAGIVGLTKSLAVEFVEHGIQVNAVAPGVIRTDMVSAFIERVGEARLASTIPAGRLGEPSEVAAAVKFLVLDAPSFLTGDVMVIDGGYLCR